jgi:ferredoxin-NADP reductase
MLIQHLVVTRISLEADQVVSVTLADPAGAELPAWEAGAHLEITLPSGLIRQYSLCSDPADRSQYTVAVLREAAGRGGSMEIHDTGLVGRTLSIRGPRNRFPIVPAAHYVLLAGGIGVTPMLAMARVLAREGRDWQLHYGGRSLDSMAFLPALERIGGERVHVHPQDVEGLLDLRGILTGLAPDTLVYCCGPTPMIDAVSATCDELGLAGELRLERFTGSGPSDEGVDGEAFEVELASSGTIVPVAANQTIIAALDAVGIEVAYSCEDGYCGTCETMVLAGVPEHRDTVLSAAEREAGDRIMICVSRAKTPRLVLDL